jgi:hypothetical protein
MNKRSGMFTGGTYRALTEVKGITFEQLYGLVKDRLQWVTQNSDHDAVCQALCCEVEKAMGIYPNTGAGGPE